METFQFVSCPGDSFCVPLDGQPLYTPLKESQGYHHFPVWYSKWWPQKVNLPNGVLLNWTAPLKFDMNEWLMFFLAVPQWQLSPAVSQQVGGSCSLLLYAAFLTNNNRFYANFGPSFWTTFVYLDSWPKIPEYRTVVAHCNGDIYLCDLRIRERNKIHMNLMPRFEAWNDLLDLTLYMGVSNCRSTSSRNKHSAHGSLSSNPKHS